MARIHLRCAGRVQPDGCGTRSAAWRRPCRACCTNRCSHGDQDRMVSSSCRALDRRCPRSAGGSRGRRRSEGRRRTSGKTVRGPSGAEVSRPTSGRRRSARRGRRGRTQATEEETTDPFLDFDAGKGRGKKEASTLTLPATPLDGTRWLVDSFRGHDGQPVTPGEGNCSRRSSRAGGSSPVRPAATTSRRDTPGMPGHSP